MSELEMTIARITIKITDSGNYKVDTEYLSEINRRIPKLRGMLDEQTDVILDKIHELFAEAAEAEEAE